MKVAVNWDTTDDEHPNGQDVGLPEEVEVPDDIELDEIADWLSDNYGWCVNSIRLPWYIRKLPVTGQPAIYAGTELMAGGLTEANANLIVSAVNACIKLNPKNPLAAAESISDLYGTCLTFQTALAIWTKDPSKAPNTLTTIFKETIGKAITKGLTYVKEAPNEMS